MSRAPVVAAFAIAIPLLGWSAIALVDDGDSEPRATSDDDPAAPPTETTPSTIDDEATDDASPEPETTDDDLEQATRDALAACATQLTAGHAVVTEAATGVGHWHEHIQARTDLLEGRNTQAETRDIWKRTRLAGPDDLERFAAVQSTYAQLPGCDDLSTALPSAQLQVDVQACLERAGRTTAAVDAAAAAIADWEAHLADMAAHADGHMTTNEAQDQWVAAWESAPDNIDAFNEARDELAQAPDCPGAGPES